MSWGDTHTEIVSVIRNNTDRSYGYQASTEKTLTKEDNGMTVTCNVNPVIGAPASDYKVLNVQCEYLLLFKI